MVAFLLTSVVQSTSDQALVACVGAQSQQVDEDDFEIERLLAQLTPSLSAEVCDSDSESPEFAVLQSLEVIIQRLSQAVDPISFQLPSGIIRSKGKLGSPECMGLSWGWLKHKTLWKTT